MYGLVKGKEKLIIQKTKKGYLLALSKDKIKVKKLVKELKAVDIIIKNFFSANFYQKINQKLKEQV